MVNEDKWPLFFHSFAGIVRNDCGVVKIEIVFFMFLVVYNQQNLIGIEDIEMMFSWGVYHWVIIKTVFIKFVTKYHRNIVIGVDSYFKYRFETMFVIFL